MTLDTRSRSMGRASCAEPRSQVLRHRGGMINCHTMSKLKVAITLDADLLDQVDTLVRERRFPSRSQAIESALAEKLERLSRTRLARECAKLDPAEERRMAEEGFAADIESWPAY
jgi:Arc/MetJ-type ribon-helix-helix transcriptional regulator